MQIFRIQMMDRLGAGWCPVARGFVCLGLGLLWANAMSAQDSTSKQKMAVKTLFAHDSSRPIPPVDSTVIRGAQDMTSESMKILSDTPKTAVGRSQPLLSKHDPQKATLRSLILPGWGQAYNHDYWKIPIVWGALSIPTITFIFNHSEYKKAQFAYSAVFNGYAKTPADQQDKSQVENMNKYYLDVWNTLYAQSPSTAPNQFLSSVANSRNYYRRNMDYSVLWFLILWGINVADATVFGHLKGFDVSPDLSLKIQPAYLQYARRPGISFVFNFK